MSALPAPFDRPRALWDEETARICAGAAGLRPAARNAVRAVLESIVGEAGVDPFTAGSARIALATLGPRGIAGPAESPVTPRAPTPTLRPWMTP
jgi:hypothetical protein